MSKLVSRKHFWVACVLYVAAAPHVFGEVRFTTLADFNGSNGGGPDASLVQGLDGNFYGTTYKGGTNNLGTVFKITPGGALTTLYSFCSEANCADGEQPRAALVLGIEGNFYGTTYGGGAHSSGTVFKITPLGTLTTIYNFCSQTNCDDGESPEAALVFGADGNFYGTTHGGGKLHDGTVFRMTPQGDLRTPYSFAGGAEGGGPTASLIQGANRDFYGTTSSNAHSSGTVFSVTPAGSFAVLYSFAGASSGRGPAAGLVQSSDGNFYGTTYYGGDYGVGTVFRITTFGTLGTLHMFTGGSDGDLPSSQLVEDSDGNLYGTTSAGGLFSDECASSNGCGTVFEITPLGELTTLHRFCAQAQCLDGDFLPAGLLQATNGQFYGTAASGGSDGYGTVFSLDVGLGPFVETLPTFAKVGSTVRILGNNLTGATSVTFNGTPATFTVGSRSYITATVPAGAITGTVQVVTPSRTLSSNVPFRVLP